jgi:hypothetical protein
MENIENLSENTENLVKASPKPGERVESSPGGQTDVSIQPDSQVNPAETIYAAIAEKVRSGSQALAQPIHIEELGSLFPDLTPDQIISHLTEQVKTEPYQDIKVMTSTSGAVYLYSDTFIAPAEASERVLAEETQEKIVGKVREDSETFSRLTATESLVELFPDLPPDKIEKYVETMTAEEKYQDIKRLSGPTGIGYLYCETHMTGNYATLLARAGAKDPCATIAETVREESRIYPRPTKVELFYTPLFQIDADQMETIVERTLQRPEYKDIQKMVASTGAVYLYSDLYLNAAFAEAWIQWEEVERYNNP